MITLHHLETSRSQRVLWLLEELAIPYEIKRYQRDPKTRLAPAALKAVHPLGKSPVIEDGGARLRLIAATHRNGKEVLISTIGPGAWVAWLPCFVPEPLATDYTAMPGSVFIALPISAVRASFNAHPALYPLVLKEIDKRMRLLMEWTSQSALLMPEQRLARLLTLLARDRKLGATDCSLAVTQAQLATLIGCSRQSANRLVANLARKGLIRLGYGTCEIPDLAALRAFSEQGP